LIDTLIENFRKFKKSTSLPQRKAVLTVIELAANLIAAAYKKVATDIAFGDSIADADTQSSLKLS
jgi:hypothetical protein